MGELFFGWMFYNESDKNVGKTVRWSSLNHKSKLFHAVIHLHKLHHMLTAFRTTKKLNYEKYNVITDPTNSYYHCKKIVGIVFLTRIAFTTFAVRTKTISSSRVSVCWMVYLGQITIQTFTKLSKNKGATAWTSWWHCVQAKAAAALLLAGPAGMHLMKDGWVIYGHVCVIFVVLHGEIVVAGIALHYEWFDKQR